MAYNEIIDQIKSASLFDVYRLRCALDHILEDPERLAELRRSLIPGRDVTYYRKLVIDVEAIDSRTQDRKSPASP